MTLASEFQDLASELLDPDFPGVVVATISSGEVTGKLSRDYIETDSIQGMRSTFLVSIEDASAITDGDAITIDGTTYVIEMREQEGIALTRLILRR